MGQDEWSRHVPAAAAQAPAAHRRPRRASVAARAQSPEQRQQQQPPEEGPGASAAGRAPSTEPAGPTGLNVDGARPTSPRGWNAMVTAMASAGVSGPLTCVQAVRAGAAHAGVGEGRQPGTQP
eukprot:360467-Chlamydomonas_euryale.AAC.4